MRVGRLDAQLDLYRILGVSPRATAAEIRRAHKRLVRLHHPDLSSWQQHDQRPSDEEMKRINHAASVLLDEVARASYDHLRQNPGASPRPAPPPAAPTAPAWYDAPPSPASPADHQAAAPASSWFDDLLRAGAVPRGSSPIPPSLFAFALLVPFVLALVAPLLGGPTPVSSPEYRIPSAPQRVTQWAR
jgi:curved DNA-binding protein CbpA